MMNDPIERVARALAAKNDAPDWDRIDEVDCGDRGYLLRDDYRALARAALEIDRTMPDEVAADLRRVFGYVPDERGGERWTVYRDHTLIVIHPERRARFFRRGRGGVPVEVEPDFL